MSTTTTEWIEGGGVGTGKPLSFFTSLWIPTSGSPFAVVLFLHGFIEHVGRYVDIFPLWAQRGIAVVAFDQRGFGRTVLDKDKNKQSGGAYGKTCSEWALADTEFMLDWTRKRFGVTRIFLMGHSMGGGLALAFPTRPKDASIPSKSIVEQLSGVIATSPLILQSSPAPKWKRSFGGAVAKISPWIKFPAAIVPEGLSRDPKVGEAYVKDPLVVQHGTLKGISTMLSLGQSLLQNDYKNWPEDLPVLVVHGTGDQVTSCKASEQFVKKISSTDKTFVAYEGGYHELHNDIDPMREKLINECCKWVEDRSSPTRRLAAESKSNPDIVSAAPASDPTTTTTAAPVADTAAPTSDASEAAPAKL